MPRPWRWYRGLVVVALVLAGCRDVATQPAGVPARVADAAGASLDAGPGLPGMTNTCVAGTWFNGIVCFPAPPGTYVDTDAATSPVPCPAGYYQPAPGQAGCVAASPGSYVWQPGQPFSFPCPAGTYSSTPAAIRCDEAPAGTYTGVGASAPIDCPAGTYAPSSGLAACLTTQAGHHSSSGAAQQVPCLLGTYQPHTGQSSCLPAPAGSYVDVPASTAATPCPAGTYQPGAGATACIPAPIGTYASEPGAQSATPCPAGTTTRAIRSTSLADCVSLFTFGGFLAPVDTHALNPTNAGRTVPIKFSLGGDQGLHIMEPGFPASQSITCDSGTPIGASEWATTPGSRDLSFDGSADVYTYGWKTSKSWSGTCRRLILRLTDGSTYTADFGFSR